MKSYKNIFRITLLVLTASAMSFNSNAQSKPCPEETGGKNNYALLVRNTQHISAALKTASQLKTSGKDYDAFEIVVCGKEVTNLIDKDNGQVKEILTQAQLLNIRLSVCGMSLNKFGIATDQVPKQVEVVENGLIRIFELQENCYFTIEL